MTSVTERAVSWSCLTSQHNECRETSASCGCWHHLADEQGGTGKPSMPPLTTCDNCGLAYYQTSAPHVCAGGVRKISAKENQVMKWDSVGLKEACQRGLAMGRTRQDFDLQLLLDMLVEIERLESLATKHEHEPVARGGEGEEWTVEGGSLVGRRRIRGAMNYWVADAATDDRAEQIVREHNQHHSLLTERERLREAIEVAIHNLNAGNDPGFLADYLRLTLDQNRAGATDEHPPTSTSGEGEQND